MPIDIGTINANKFSVSIIVSAIKIRHTTINKYIPVDNFITVFMWIVLVDLEYIDIFFIVKIIFDFYKHLRLGLITKP